VWLGTTFNTRAEQFTEKLAGELNRNKKEIKFEMTNDD
jgi:hypothetical protein